MSLIYYVNTSEYVSLSLSLEVGPRMCIYWQTVSIRAVLFRLYSDLYVCVCMYVYVCVDVYISISKAFLCSGVKWSGERSRELYEVGYRVEVEVSAEGVGVE